MEKYQGSHSLVQQHQRKAELQVLTVGHKRILPFHLGRNVKVINFAENCSSISLENIRIINHCRKILLFYNEYDKKEYGSSFDVKSTTKKIMTAPLTSQWVVVMVQNFVSWLVYIFSGQLWWRRTSWVDWYIYIQCLLESTLEKDLMGLYRDDGHIILCNTNSQQTDKIRKNIMSIFKSIDFKIEITTNLTKLIF